MENILGILSDNSGLFLGGGVAGRKLGRQLSGPTQVAERMEAAGGGRSLAGVVDDIDLPGPARRTYGDPENLWSKISLGFFGTPDTKAISAAGDEIATALKDHVAAVGRQYDELGETFSSVRNIDVP